MKEAGFYEKLKDLDVQCHLCAHRCRIPPGKRGICGVRENRDGTLYSLVYGRLIAANVDPIEKKPLFHFLPGSRSYSIATVGCNFQCLFCQNADISQAPREHGRIVGETVAPEKVVEDARRTGSATIAYTYTEPTIFMEYALDVAEKARAEGLRNVFVTNGYMTAEALRQADGLIDAVNVDLKAFTDTFYRKQCGARLQPVLDTLHLMKSMGIWLEVTTLVIPGLNDDPAELREIARFLVTLGPETPWHVSRFHPTYRLTDRPPTPVETVRKARDIGLEAGLHYVYTGNVFGDRGESTFCHQCGEILLERTGFSVHQRGIKQGACLKCGARVAGVGLP